MKVRLPAMLPIPLLVLAATCEPVPSDGGTPEGVVQVSTVVETSRPGATAGDARAADADGVPAYGSSSNQQGSGEFSGSITTRLEAAPSAAITRVEPNNAQENSAGIAAITVTGTPVMRIPGLETIVSIDTPTPTLTPTATPTGTPTPTPTTGAGSVPAVGGCQVFPADNPWNTDVSQYPAHPNSANFIAAISAGGKTKLHPDWGGGGQYGIPYIVVPSSQPMVDVTWTAYGDESDPGPYPIPLNAPIEGGPSSDGDRHVLAVRQGECVLYELYRAFPQSTSWAADSGARWPLNTNALRPLYWTSADAAGLPILPGLVRYDEVAAGAINHALRFTSWRTQRGFILPATHFASSYTDPNLPPMGLRLRLKASYDISGYTGQARVVLEALKKYGMIVADNGSSWYVTGAADPRWDDIDLNQLKNVPGSAFEAVYTGDIIH
jgi:hypothetical protein